MIATRRSSAHAALSEGEEAAEGLFRRYILKYDNIYYVKL